MQRWEKMKMRVKQPRIEEGKKKRTALPSGSRFRSNGCSTVAYIKSPSSSVNHKQRKGLLYTSKPQDFRSAAFVLPLYTPLFLTKRETDQPLSLIYSPLTLLTMRIPGTVFIQPLEYELVCMLRRKGEICSAGEHSELRSFLFVEGWKGQIYQSEIVYKVNLAQQLHYLNLAHPSW